MRYKTFVEPWCIIPFGEGQLRIDVTIDHCVDAYGPLPTVHHRRLVFESSRGKLYPLSEIAEIGCLAQSERVNVPAAVAERPLDFAVLLAEHEQVGSVVYASVRWGWFPQEFGIAIEPNVPRIEDERLVFLTVEMGLDVVERQVRDISWDLASLQYVVNVRRRTRRSS